MPALTSEQARQVYDRIGRAQDWQRFYENAATADLVAHAGFDAAHSIVELGCGTGRFAAGLLTRHLPADASYVGVDLSPRMVALASERLRPWRDRARVSPRRRAGSGRLGRAPSRHGRGVGHRVRDRDRGALDLKRASTGILGGVDTPAEPFTCSLEGPELVDRIEAWREVVPRATSRGVENDRVVAVYPKDAQLLGRLRALVASEAECCSFLLFDVEETPHAIVTELRLPEGMPDSVRTRVVALFAD
jgi:hypothetical protein